MTYLEILRAQLTIDEDNRPRPYDDETGKTLAAGMLLRGKITVGIGHNLTDRGVSPAVTELMFQEDSADAEADARALFADFDGLSDVRKAVVVNMAFNLGRQRLAGFVATIRAINERRWGDAAQGMLNSKWARQVGARAQRLAEAMRSDQ